MRFTEVDSFEKPVHLHKHAHTLSYSPPQAQRQIGGDFWPFKDYHNIMRKTNLMRKPFPWPWSIPIKSQFIHSFTIWTCSWRGSVRRLDLEATSAKTLFLQHNVFSLCPSFDFFFVLIVIQSSTLLLLSFSFTKILLQISVLLSFDVCVGSAGAPR